MSHEKLLATIRIDIFTNGLFMERQFKNNILEGRWISITPFPISVYLDFSEYEDGITSLWVWKMAGEVRIDQIRLAKHKKVSLHLSSSDLNIDMDIAVQEIYDTPRMA